MAPKIRFDLTSFDRRQLPLLIGALVVIVAAVVGLILVLTGGKEPDVGGSAISTAATPPPSATPSLMPTLTLAGPTASSPPVATATLEPYQYVVQPGDTLYYILGLFGYRELDVVPEVLALNNMSAENDLFADRTILIPRQTPTQGPTSTPTLTPGAGTPTADPNITPDYTDCSPEDRCLSPDGQYWLHTVRQDETCAQVAYLYDTTVPDVIRDNNLTQNCIIHPGQVLRVLIRVTLTPTLTPTGGPNSTPTPTPTLLPPMLLHPINEASIARSGNVVLQWVATEALNSNETYLVVLTDTSSGHEYRWTTRSNVYRLPIDLRPGAGQSIIYQWQVVIVSGSSTESLIVSGQDGGRTFTWGS